MHIHFIGICGTFMGGCAVLAKALGYEVSGSDHQIYPPMSTQLEKQGIALWAPTDLQSKGLRPDCVVIGNSASRGHPEVEYVLNQQWPYTSGPAWLFDHVLHDKWVLAVAGTHGKTTTSSLLAWILDYAGHDPGFLIGGVPQNFGMSARLSASDSPYFVIEADEYDTAFFDKRSKFVHYHPRTAILNNCEFDHADIFADLAAIETQFHHFVRTIPGKGRIIFPQKDLVLSRILERGAWSEILPILTEPPAGGWNAILSHPDGSAFTLCTPQGEYPVEWSLMGVHNVHNAVAAAAAAHHVGISPQTVVGALATFRSVARRLEVRAQAKHLVLYEDFAHHPTAIATVLAALRAHAPEARIVVCLDLASNTMKKGVHQHHLAAALQEAQTVHIYAPSHLAWDLGSITTQHAQAIAYPSIDSLFQAVAQDLLKEKAEGGPQKPVYTVIMSNGSFGGLCARLVPLF